MTEQNARFTELYEARWRAVYAYLVRRGAQPDDAADLVHATFLTAWTKLGTVPTGTYELAWLLATARNHWANFQRRSASETVMKAAEQSRVRSDHSPDPGQVVMDFMLEQRVWTAIGDLPPDDRELVTLVAWDGLSPAQASRALGISRGAARVRLHRARKRLIEQLENSASPATDDWQYSSTEQVYPTAQTITEGL